MSALVAGFLLIGYLLGPGVIYRLVFSFFIPSKRFQRNRTEEIVFSILVTLVPFLLTWVFLHMPLGWVGHFTVGGSKDTAYRLIIKSLLPGPDLDKTLLSDAYLRGFLEQSRFLGLLWLLCGLEGWLAGRMVASYGDYPDDSRRKRFCDKFLLTYVSEWEILFTSLALPGKDSDVVIEVDALSTMDVLYRGKLDDWFLDSDGKLEGIFLKDAFRFRKEDLDRDRTKGIHKSGDTYWRQIPGAKLYLVASTLANYNIRYTQPQPKPSLEDVCIELGDDDVLITPLPREVSSADSE